MFSSSVGYQSVFRLSMLYLKWSIINFDVRDKKRRTNEHSFLFSSLTRLLNDAISNHSCRFVVMDFGPQKTNC